MFAALAQLGAAVSSYWRSGLGGLSVVGIIGVVDGFFYYRVFDIPFGEYVEWGDFTRIGIFGGLYASLLALLLGLFVILAVAVAIIILGVAAGLFAHAADLIVRTTGRTLTLVIPNNRALASLTSRVATLASWTALANLFATARAAAIRGLVWIGDHKNPVAAVLFAVFVTIYVVAHSYQAARVVDFSTHAGASECRRSTESNPISREACGLVGAFLATAWPNLTSRVAAFGADGASVSREPLTFIGKVGSHYAFLTHQPAPPPLAPPRAINTMILLSSGIRSIRTYSASDPPDPTPDERLTRINVGVFGAPDSWSFNPRDGSFAFSVHFANDGDANLVDYSDHLLQHVGKALAECVHQKKVTDISIEVLGQVSSAGIPDSQRDSPDSLQRQTELAENRARVIKEHLQKSLRDAPDVEVTAKTARLDGPFRDRTDDDTYLRRLGLLNRRSMVTVYMEPGFCELR